MTFKYAGRFDDAERAYRQTRTILEAIDADPEDLAALYHNLGGLAHVRRDFAAAEELSRRAIEIRSSALGPRHAATLLDRSAHAAILDGLGRHDEAEASIRDILGDLEAALGADHPEVAVALNNLAAIVQRRGDLPQAEELYRRVIAIKEARLGADSPALAVPLNNLGSVLRAAGRPDEARAAFERALRLLEGEVADDHPNLATIRRNLATRLGCSSRVGRSPVDHAVRLGGPDEAGALQDADRGVVVRVAPRDDAVDARLAKRPIDERRRGL